MVRESCKKQLEGLLQAISEMGQRVLEGLARGLDSWDDGIDRLSLEIEKQCTDLLALQRPRGLP